MSKSNISREQFHKDVRLDDLEIWFTLKSRSNKLDISQKYLSLAQISIIPKPECFGDFFGGPKSLTSLRFTHHNEPAGDQPVG